MEFKELFETGMSYETFLSIASEDEREKIAKITENISISDELLEKIQKIDRPYNFLLSAESWCPYVRATVPVLAKLTKLNSNIKLGIITEGRGFLFLRDKLGIPEDLFVVPTLAILDENCEFVNRYLGKPTKYRNIGFEKVKRDFFAGYLANDIVEEIVAKMEK